MSTGPRTARILWPACRDQHSSGALPEKPAQTDLQQRCINGRIRGSSGHCRRLFHLGYPAFPDRHHAEVAGCWGVLCQGDTAGG